jgi:hypothetical protein
MKTYLILANHLLLVAFLTPVLLPDSVGDLTSVSNDFEFLNLVDVSGITKAQLWVFLTSRYMLAISCSHTIGSLQTGKLV